MLNHFCSYDALKKYIYQLEKQQHDARIYSHDIEAATEHTSLVGRSALAPDTDALFHPLLDAELRKVSSFYSHQEKELLEELTELEDLVKEQDEMGLVAGRLYTEGEGDWDDDDEDDDDDEEWQSTERSRDRRGNTSTSRRRRKPSNAASKPLNPSNTGVS